MNVKLVVVQGKPEGKEIPLRIPKFLIGRGTECHLRPNSELVSRHHCMFIISERGIVLRDLGSTNGTLVNGARINGEVVVHHEDLIQIGPLGFRIVVEPVPSVAPAKLAPIPQPVPAATVLAKVAALGRRDAGDRDVEQWLLSDSKHEVPDSGSGVYSGDTEMHLQTTIDRREGQDTKPEITPPPIVAEPPKEREDKVVELDGGVKLKLSSAKLKIEKTREDTSRAAAEILRRMMERKPGN